MTAEVNLKTEAVWSNEPAEWRMAPDGRLTARAKARTDFWRKTRNGFIAESGHFYSIQVRGDFSLRARVAGEFRQLYDQAGLMVLADSLVWLKAGIEYLDGVRYISSVVTHDFSDWALCRPLAGEAVWLVIERDRNSLVVSAALDGQNYFIVRECTLTENLTLEVGPYLCSPAGEGFAAAFESFEIALPRHPRRG